MKTAYLELRHRTDKRYQIFCSGLQRHGYRIAHGIPGKTRDGDLFVSWNRLAAAHRAAARMEKRGHRVLIAENASFGNLFRNRHWFHIARNYHNTQGNFDYGGPERWDRLGVDLPPFRTEGETVILPQRGIGPPGIAMPRSWPADAIKRYRGRVRPHPGKNTKCIPLQADLRKAGRVVTWGSGAAIGAAIMGIPVISEMPGWIGQQDNTDEGRLDMLRHLVWAQWTHEEIANGYAFERLLNPA